MCQSVECSSGPVFIYPQCKNQMITDIKPYNFTVTVLLVIIQYRFSDTIFFILEQLQACLNLARLGFHVTVSRASQGRFLLPCSLGKFIEQKPVSKVMALLGPVACLMRGCIYPVLSGKDTRWASLSLQTCCEFLVST